MIKIIHAQDERERAYIDSPVTKVDYIHVEYGRFEEYIDWLNSTWKPMLSNRAICASRAKRELDRKLLWVTFMKSLLLGLIFLGACAGSRPHYTNVAAVRQDIKATIETDNAHPRSIVSMGHTTNDSAVIYTKAATGGPTVEESWVREGGAWTMKGSVP